MKFIYFDLILLAVFSILVAFFLIRNRKKLKIESKVFLLYRTKVGIRFINWITKILSPVMPTLTWISISFGFFLMAAMIYLLVQSLVMLARIPLMINAPPLMPILPYVPQAFNLPFPDFYFMHWIVAIVLLATTHEAAHGIFASFYKIKIKATGFGFLGPFLAAFVEPDEKIMRKRNAKQQLSILSAGSFSNLIFGIIFILLFQLFFVAVYVPAGVGNYIFMYQTLNLTNIDSVGEYSADSFLELPKEEMLKIEKTLLVRSDDKNYFLTPEIIKEIAGNKKSVQSQGTILAFEDTPAFNASLSGGFLKIDDYEIKNIEDITIELSRHKPGEEIIITTSEGTYEIILAEHPEKKSQAYLGIAFSQTSVLSAFSSPFLDPYLHVESKFNKDVLNFIEGFFIWIILIFFLVALFNMLPLGFLDGGRFLYIFALALTHSKEKATKIFKVFSSLIILIFFLMMLIWAIKINSC